MKTKPFFRTRVALLIALAFSAVPLKAAGLVNGDISAGNTGFASDYVYTAGVSASPGTYSVVTDPRNFNPALSSFGDHTSGSGNMLVFDGVPTSTVWSQTVDVTPGKWYQFSFYAASTHPEAPARLRSKLGDRALSQLNLSAVPGQWQKSIAYWYSDAATSVTLTIFNSSAAGFGNDFALDDLEFTELAGAPPAGVSFSEAVALKADAATGIPDAKFTSFGSPALNGHGGVAFTASITGTSPSATAALHGNTTGIWADDSTGTRQLVVQKGALAPGTTGAIFATFGDPVYNQSSKVAFLAKLKPGVGDAVTKPVSNLSGIWSDQGGALHLVARTGMQAPGCPAGATFLAFVQIALPDQGGVVILANLKTGTTAAPDPGGTTSVNNVGIWAENTAGELQLLVRKGDFSTITGADITGLTFLSPPTAVGGQTRSFDQATGDLLYRANFKTTTGIFRIVLP